MSQTFWRGSTARPAEAPLQSWELQLNLEISPATQASRQDELAKLMLALSRLDLLR
jgi:hypothetical protein